MPPLLPIPPSPLLAAYSAGAYLLWREVRGAAVGVLDKRQLLGHSTATLSLSGKICRILSACGKEDTDTVSHTHETHTHTDKHVCMLCMGSLQEGSLSIVLKLRSVLLF